MRSWVIAVGVVVSSAYGTVAAQSVTNERLRVALDEGASASRAIDAQRVCLDAKREAIQRTSSQLRDAERQLSAGGQAARDAETMIGLLADRMSQLVREVQACAFATNANVVTRTTTVTTTATGEPIAVTTPAPSSVETEGDTVPALLRNEALVPRVTVQVAERVDGSGQVEADGLRAGLRAIGPSLAQCYDQMLDRAALESGTLTVAFALQASGRPSRVLVEAPGMTDAALRRCVAQSVTALRVPPPAGGHATLSVTFRFSAQ